MKRPSIRITKPLLVILITAITTTFLLTAGSQSEAASKAKFKWPSPVVISTQDVGSSNYLIAGGLANAMKIEGIKVRVVPAGTEPGRLSLVMNERALWTHLGLSGSFLSMEGVLDWGQLDWGPQPVRLAVAGTPKGLISYVTAKDAGIKTWADAKGKRFAYIVGSAGCETLAAANLAFAGLTWDDVVKVEVPGFGPAGRAVIQGKADAACGGTSTAWAFQLKASPRGVHVPPMPHNDVEGWKRALKVCPYCLKAVAQPDDGVGLAKDRPTEGLSYGFSTVVVKTTSSPELVYNIAKVVIELYDKYKNVGRGVEQLSLKRLVLSNVVPYHEGAVRYYKEIGAWTSENQKHNDRLIARQKVLQKAWDKAIDEKAAKKVRAKKFYPLWMKIRAESLKAAGFEPYYE